MQNLITLKVNAVDVGAFLPSMGAQLPGALIHVTSTDDEIMDRSLRVIRSYFDHERSLLVTELEPILTSSPIKLCKALGLHADLQAVAISLAA